MKKPNFLDEAFKNICYELLQMFLKKHKDYGKGNIIETGEMGILFRISDKVNRLKHLVGNNKTPNNETKEETWIDIAVYAVIAVLYGRGWFQKLNLKTDNYQKET